jgi:glycosyltransferase involved in cell wall biosynthesis
VVAAPDVTVLMCVYNGESYVRDAVDSILAQSYRNFEFLIIDDGSTDTTSDLLASYVDRRIRILRNRENRGLTPSLNLGLREARGHWIARQDADDISYPDRLARQISFLDRHPEVMLLGTQFDSVDERGRRRGPHLWMKCEAALAIRWQLMFENPFVHSTVIVRRDVVLDSLGGYDEAFRTNQDFELWSRLARSYGSRNLPESLVACRGRRTSISSQYRASALRAVKEVLLQNIAETIGPAAGAKDGVDAVLGGMLPRVYGPPATLAPLVSWIDTAYRSFIAIWPEGKQLREIRVHAASLIARLATIAASTAPMKAGRWYVRAAGYDLPTFARGTPRFALTCARSLTGRVPFLRRTERKLNEDTE